MASLSTGAAGQALELQVRGRTAQETRAWGPGRNEAVVAGTSKWSFPAPTFLLSS